MGGRGGRFGKAVTHQEPGGPRAALARGYSVTTAGDGKVLKREKQTKAGVMVATHLAEGWVESEIRTVPAQKKTRARKKAD